MNYFNHGFMTSKDLKDAKRYLYIDITPYVFKKICETMQENNHIYNSKYNFEYHKKIRLMREQKYGGVPQ